jgi:hypothetical protein
MLLGRGGEDEEAGIIYCDARFGNNGKFSSGFKILLIFY